MVLSRVRASSSTTSSSSSLPEVFDADAIAERERRRRVSPGNNAADGGGKNADEWAFFDTARINVSGGDGGNGCVAFRREKGEARGGPSGGRGGNGGDVVLVCDESLNTLAPSRNRVHVRGRKGDNGTGKSRDGARGDAVHVRVPRGTSVRELRSQKLAGELRRHGETLVVSRGGRGGRGNAAFMTARNTAPKLAERGEPGASRWLSLELRLVADVGFLGKPNAGKSTLLAAASNARPKIADYPFTTIVPNLGVCDLDDFGDGKDRGGGTGLVLCDVPGLIEGAADGAGLGPAFLRHVQRCRVLLHVVDGTSDDPLGDFDVINQELRNYDPCLAEKPQVVVLNKIDVPDVRDQQDDLLAELRKRSGHTRVLPISAATTANVRQLMERLHKFVSSRPRGGDDDLDGPAPPPEIDLAKAGLESDGDDFTILSDPAYPGQWRVQGEYVEQVAKMTHWEYPEAVERFGRQLQALGIADELGRQGAQDGDLIMIDDYDFEFTPGFTNPYIPAELLEKDALEEEQRAMLLSNDVDDDAAVDDDKEADDYWDYLDEDELVGFNDSGDWDALDADDADFDNFELREDDEVWSY